jgi:predicted RNase H-like nuclease (RuvC/YqgF family)
VEELEEESGRQRRALAESEKHWLRLQKLSELRESTLQSTLNSCERMVNDMETLESSLSTAQARLKDALSEKVKLEATLEVELQSSGSLKATIQSRQAENSALKSELQSTQAARDRCPCLLSFGVAMPLRFQHLGMKLRVSQFQHLDPLGCAIFGFI